MSGGWFGGVGCDELFLGHSVEGGVDGSFFEGCWLGVDHF